MKRKLIALLVTGIAVAAAAFLLGRIAAVRSSLVVWRGAGETSEIRQLGFLAGPFTGEARDAARCVRDYLAGKDGKKLEEALDRYRALTARGVFGAEHLTLRWLCEYLRAPESGRRELLKNRAGERFIRFASPRGYARLQRYLAVKCGESAGSREEEDEVRFMEELMRGSCPERGEWERADAVMALAGIEEGDAVADVGCATGFYSLMLSEKVGARGKVFAVDGEKANLDYVAGVTHEEGTANIEPIHARAGAFAPPQKSLDCVFFGGGYGAVYCAMRRAERTPFVEKLNRSLKPGGGLVVTGTSPSCDGGAAFGGMGLSKELITLQLKGYGFRLEGEYAPSPQRYVLVFRPGR